RETLALGRRLQILGWMFGPVPCDDVVESLAEQDAGERQRLLDRRQPAGAMDAPVEAHVVVETRARIEHATARGRWDYGRARTDVNRNRGRAPARDAATRRDRRA